MNAIVIEHVKVGDLPEEWRARLATDAEAHVTIRVEEETSSSSASAATAERADDPAFGMWSDRTDMTDVDAYVRKLRAPRFPSGA